ncbi:zinc finger protein with KRAB and SCAN domains 7 isoform X2 [Drosophila teissieri]|uniref:zinc finger protein with KRAB and SCAN domains 7 isoform X2 n=1 Tax=Drosophila teissieri TaxID=7243 RepID=UPI001CB9D8DF|nr:zinc finger protein with KRAB and SCAN domains 7 isoform X2 [Drosophila teissieri]
MEISIKWSMCRTCRKKGSQSTLQSLFESDAHKLLISYAGTAVEPDDGLPDQICADCLERLEEVDRFLSECKQSDEHLRSLVRQTLSSAAAFQTLEDKDTSGQKKRTRKQNISGRVIDENPIIFKTEEDLLETAKHEEFPPVNKHPSDFVFVLNVNPENEKNTHQEDYTICDLDLDRESTGHNDSETYSQEGSAATDGVQETSEDYEKLEPTAEYEIDLGVACEPDKYRCKICSNTYPYVSQLNAHMQMHRKEKGHECEVCQKTFRAACNLKTHMRTHTGEKPYKCSFCSRHFADSSTHRKHQRYAVHQFAHE